MISLTARIFMLDDDAISDALGSGDTKIIRNAWNELEKSGLPSDVQEKVGETIRNLVNDGPPSPYLDLISSLALIYIIREIGEEAEVDSLMAVPSLQGVLRAMGELISYNVDVHLFGNPPPPFKAIDTAGTPIDIGFLDHNELEEFCDTLDTLELPEDDQMEFSDEHGLELMEELVEPLQEVFGEARASGREIIVITEG